MNDAYSIRRALSANDAPQLKRLFNDVFHPQVVGEFAETIFLHFPRTELKYWFIAEEKASSRIVSAFTLIPWTWSYHGIELKAAEMGIVGTDENHRGRGLMYRLNEEFDKTLAAEGYDLSFIQGIPGFYQKFGFQYSVPLDNHINLSFSSIPADEPEDVSFRLATLEDIPFLMKEDEKYRDFYDISVVRDEVTWRYLLTHSLETEYGSEYWIIEGENCGGPFYIRIPGFGFGNGLIVSETSEDMSYQAFIALLHFCHRKAVERGKPYIRFNLHSESTVGSMALALGADREKQHACQIKIPDRAAFLQKIAPVLEERLKRSVLRKFTGTLRLDFFTESIDMVWTDGCLDHVRPGSGSCDEQFCISSEHFAAFCLGHRTWRELKFIKPDIFPMSRRCSCLIDILFPSTVSWIHEQY